MASNRNNHASMVFGYIKTFSDVTVTEYSEAALTQLAGTTLSVNATIAPGSSTTTIEDVDAAAVTSLEAGTFNATQSGSFGGVGPTNVAVNQSGHMLVDIANRGVFGELGVANYEPVFQLHFIHGFNQAIVKAVSFGGGAYDRTNVTVGRVSTSTGAGDRAFVQSRAVLSYRPGQGIDFRFTGMWPGGGQTGTIQYLGCGDFSNGYFLGYNGTSFGILHRTGGQIHTQSLVITAAASGGGTITITLDGNAHAGVVVPGAASIQEVAYLISQADYTTVGDGWTCQYFGDRVEFSALKSGPKGGTYSYDAGTTGTAATFSNLITGVAATDTWIPQANWNFDVMDGSGVLPSSDWTKANIFRIVIGWLGYATATYEMMHATLGWVPFHRQVFIKSDTPSNAGQLATNIEQPRLRFHMEVDNLAATPGTGLDMRSASICAMQQGNYVTRGLTFSAISGIVTAQATEYVVLVLRPKTVYGALQNSVLVKLMSFSAINDSPGRSCSIKVYINPAMSGPALTWNDVSTEESVVEYATPAIGDVEITAGNVTNVFGIAPEGSTFVDASIFNMFLQSTDLVVLTARMGASTGPVEVAVNFTEVHS